MQTKTPQENISNYRKTKRAEAVRREIESKYPALKLLRQEEYMKIEKHID